MDGFEESAKLFKTLMHPARLEILETLRDGEHCVCHMEAALGYRQAYISQQLSVLREAGLVADRRDGWNIYYRVIQPQVFVVLDAAQPLSSDPKSKRHTARRAVECPCPQCNSVETVRA
jgi:ArsR family transcriptional regulator